MVGHTGRRKVAGRRKVVNRRGVSALDCAGEPYVVMGAHVTEQGGRRERQGGHSKGRTRTTLVV